MTMRRPMQPQRPGKAANRGGWTQPLDELWTQTCAELRALKERVTVRTADPIGVPAVYQGVKVFAPSTQTLVITNPNDLVTPWTVNPVLVDGVAYEIPVYAPGPGVFVARSIDVSIYQRYVLPSIDGRPSQDMRFIARATSTSMAQDATMDGALRQYRYSVLGDPRAGSLASGWPVYSTYVPTRGEEGVPSAAFWWNLLDAKSQRYLADGLMPDQALMPMTSSRVQSRFSGAFPIDGGRFTFDAPWLVERDGQFRFVFQPTTAVYQLASTPLDQRQTVSVQVDLFGERYETLQDAIRAGAMTRPVRAEEE